MKRVTVQRTTKHGPKLFESQFHKGTLTPNGKGWTIRFDEKLKLDPKLEHRFEIVEETK